MSTKALTYTGLERLVRDVKNDVGLLDMPKGEILHLSAGGCTTESIAQENGVIDVSGNGNHGQGIDNISVVNDDKKGFCYDFNNGCIEGNLNFGKTLTLALNLYLKNTHNLNYANLFLSNKRDYAYFQVSISSQKLMTINLYDNGNKNRTKIEYSVPSDEWHSYVFVVDLDNKILSFFVNGELEEEKTIPYDYTDVTELTSYRMGRLSSSWYLKCKMSDIRIYPYALTPTQVKTLYMLQEQPLARVHSRNIIEPTDMTSSEIETMTSEIFTGE